MKTLKSLGDISGLHNLRTIPRLRKSAKPQLPTTAILALTMTRSERDRLAKEKMKLCKRKNEVDKRLEEIEKEMDNLLEQIRKKSLEIRGAAGTLSLKTKEKNSDKKMVIEY